MRNVLDLQTIAVTSGIGLKPDIAEKNELMEMAKLGQTFQIRPKGYLLFVCFFF